MFLKYGKLDLEKVWFKFFPLFPFLVKQHKGGERTFGSFLARGSTLESRAPAHKRGLLFVRAMYGGE